MQVSEEPDTQAAEAAEAADSSSAAADPSEVEVGGD